MVNKLWKKGLVLGIILLFIGASVVPNMLVRNVRADDPTIIKITDNSVFDAGRSLIQSASGNYYLVFDSNRGGNRDIWLSESSGITSWGVPRRVTTYSGVDSTASLAQANNGDLLVTFASTQGSPWGWKTYLTRSTDGGYTWSTPVLIEPYCSGNPNILKASDGTLYLSRHCLSGTSTTKVSKSTDNGNSWTHISTISNHPYVLHSEMREYNGDLYMVCDSRQDINPNPSHLYFYKSTDGGYTWIEISSIVSNYEDRAPTFVRSDEGQYIAVWLSDDREASGTKNLYYSTSDDYVSWSTPQPLMGSANYNDASPYLFKDNSGEIFLSWASDEDGDYEVYLAKLSDLEEAELYLSAVWQNELDEMITPHDIVDLKFTFKNNLDTTHSFTLTFESNNDVIQEFEEISVNIENLGPGAEYYIFFPIKIAGINNDQIINEIIENDLIIPLTDSIKITISYDLTSVDYLLAPKNIDGEILYIQYPDYYGLSNSNGYPTGINHDNFYRTGDTDLHHPGHELVRKYSVAAASYPEQNFLSYEDYIFPDDPANIMDNIFRFVDGLFKDNPEQISAIDLNIVHWIEAGNLNPGEKQEDMICVTQAYLLTSFARTIGFSARELTVALGYGGGANGNIKYDQEGASQVWYDNAWHLFDTYYEIKSLSEYLKVCAQYRAWYAYDQRSSTVWYPGYYGHNFGVGEDYGIPMNPEEWIHLDDDSNTGMMVIVKSPVTTYIIDDEGNLTGWFNDTIFEEISGSYYVKAGTLGYFDHNDPNAFFEYEETIFIPVVEMEESSYLVVITGLDNGEYSLIISGIGDILNNITVGPCQIWKDMKHIFEIDKNIEGNIIISRIPAIIDIDPNTLNLKSKGKWVTSYIELPEGYNVTNINISTILLNDVVPAEDHPINISDYDNDDIPDLMVKFDRQDVQDILEVGENVAITITGKLFDETMFEGTDYIKVI